MNLHLSLSLSLSLSPSIYILYVPQPRRRNFHWSPNIQALLRQERTRALERCRRMSYLSIYLHRSLSLSLSPPPPSLSIYIYVYIYTYLSPNGTVFTRIGTAGLGGRSALARRYAAEEWAALRVVPDPLVGTPFLHMRASRFTPSVQGAEEY